MHRTKLRKVGGSVMLAVPPPLLDILELQAGATVGVTVEDDRLVIVAERRPSYTLDELLAACDPSSEPAVEDLAWDQAPAVGRELI